MILRFALVVLVSTSAFAAALTPAEKRGRHIYQHGESSAGHPMTALVGGTELGAGIFACATCHGADGRGVAEGTVEPSDVRWSALQAILLKPRKRPRYDDERLARAINEGVDSAGNPLSPVMPRFRMAGEDLADLVAYLKRLGNEPQPGLTGNSVTVTTAAPGTMSRTVIDAYFKDVNAAGGIFGRTLRIADVPVAEAFAVIGATEGVESSFDGERVPLITPFPTASPAPSSFFLFSDLESQALALARHAEADGRAVHVLHDGSPAALTAASALTPRTTAAQWDAIAKAKRTDDDLLFLIGQDVDVVTVIRGVQSLQWSPRILIAGAKLTPELFTAPASLRIFIAAPTLPTDRTDEGRHELHAFALRHAIPPEQLSTQIATYAATKVFIEGLKRAGRDVTREKLIASLEQLYQFPTGLTPPVSYARNLHMGSTGAHILSVDLATRAIVPVAWVGPR